MQETAFDFMIAYQQHETNPNLNTVSGYKRGNNEISQATNSGTANPRGAAPAYESKKRFIWPDSLHREFTCAIFDAGLKKESLKQLNSVISSRGFNISPQYLEARIAQMAEFRVSCIRLGIFFHPHDGTASGTSVVCHPNLLSGIPSSVHAPAADLILVPLEENTLREISQLQLTVQNLWRSIYGQISFIDSLRENVKRQAVIFTQMLTKLMTADPSFGNTLTPPFDNMPSLPSWVEPDPLLPLRPPPAEVPTVHSRRSRRDKTDYVAMNTGIPSIQSHHGQSSNTGTHVSAGTGGGYFDPYARAAGGRDNGPIDDLLDHSLATSSFDTGGLVHDDGLLDSTLGMGGPDGTDSSSATTARAQLKLIVDMKANMGVHRRLETFKANQISIFGPPIGQSSVKSMVRDGSARGRRKGEAAQDYPNTDTYLSTYQVERESEHAGAVDTLDCPTLGSAADGWTSFVDLDDDLGLFSFLEADGFSPGKK